MSALQVGVNAVAAVVTWAGLDWVKRRFGQRIAGLTCIAGIAVCVSVLAGVNR